MAQCWVGSYLDEIYHHTLMVANSLEGEVVDGLGKDRSFSLAIEKSLSVESSSCSQPANARWREWIGTINKSAK